MRATREEIEGPACAEEESLFCYCNYTKKKYISKLKTKKILGE